MTTATSELIQLTQLIHDFGLTLTAPTLLFCDNQATLHIAYNPIFHKRTKHIELDCHFVSEQVATGCLKLLPIRSSKQLADLFIKPLPLALLLPLLSKMAVKDIHSPS